MYPSAVVVPFQFLFNTILKIFRFVLQIIRPDPITRDPVLEVSKFVEDFEGKYGNRHPLFYRGSYASALAEAKRDLKFLLVYLHSPDHQDTHSFCSQVLTFPEVVSYINRNNILFWASSVSYPEGHRVSVTLKESTYPFLALIVLKDNRMVVVRRFEGKMSVESLLSQLEQGIEDNEQAIGNARAEREERTMNQRIREEQDLDYQKSLEIDRQKERLKQEEKKKRDSEERLRQQKQQEEKDKRNRLLALKAAIRENLPPEPDSSHPDVIRILAKLPDGTRLERRFLRSMSVKYLYFFVFSQEKSPLTFQITTNFPRKELPCSSPTLDNPDCFLKTYTGEEEEPPSFADAGLGKNEMLFVYDLEA